MAHTLSERLGMDAQVGGACAIGRPLSTARLTLHRQSHTALDEFIPLS